jgi:hypothetical protein
MLYMAAEPPPKPDCTPCHEQHRGVAKVPLSQSASANEDCKAEPAARLWRSESPALLLRRASPLVPLLPTLATTEAVAAFGFVLFLMSWF